MSIKLRVENLEAVPEALREYYQPDEAGGFRLAIDGVVEKARLDEFRNTNIALRKENESLKQTLQAYEGVDLKRVQELEEQARALEQKQLLDQGKVDELIQKRVESVRQEWQKQVAAMKAEREALEKQLQKRMIDDALKEAALKAGALPSALPDILGRARDVWVLENGEPVARRNGERLYTDMGEPLSIHAWIQSLQQEAGHLFAPSAGSGAAGGSRSGGRKALSWRDTEALNQHLEQIARGEVDVTE